MKKYLLLSALLILGCNKGLDGKFRETAMEYQKKFPVPTKRAGTGPARYYIYQAAFYKKNKDTLFILTRKSSIDSSFFDGYEVYRDNELHFMVLDIDHLSQDFVHKRGKEMEKSFWSAGDSFGDRYTALYRYKVKNKAFNLVAIDSTFEMYEDLVP